MKITERKITVRELAEGFHEDDATSRVTAWGGKLDVRPEFQREFVYKDEQRDAVINTVLNGFPLNIMYFVDRQDGSYEVLDGQQRIISIGRYVNNEFSVKIPTASGQYNSVNFPNLFDEQAKAFLDYKLTIYICEGTDEEKFNWFQIINIAGEVLEKQEILNALYHGPWLTSAKSVLSRKNCVAYKAYGKYMAGEYIRQKYLETAFSWKAAAEGFTGKDAIAAFMRAHRADKDADELWSYFENVFKWVRANFGNDADKSMKGVAWGLLYNEHRDDNLDPKYLQKRVKELLANDEVTAKSGIYAYLLERETPAAEKHLHPRQFSASDAQTLYNRQNGRCALCGKPFELKDMHADHIKPWSKGGRTALENGQMLCATCNLKKGSH